MRRAVLSTAVSFLLSWMLAASFRPALAADPVVDLKLVVTNDRAVAELWRREIEDAIAIDLTRNNCGLRLAPADQADRAALLVELRLVQWREIDEPGGEPVFDPATGRDKPGHQHEVEIHYLLTTRSSAATEPISKVERRLKYQKGTARLSGFDPNLFAQTQAIQLLAREVTRAGCKAAKTVRRAATR